MPLTALVGRWLRAGRHAHVAALASLAVTLGFLVLSAPAASAAPGDGLSAFSLTALAGAPGLTGLGAVRPAGAAKPDDVTPAIAEPVEAPEALTPAPLFAAHATLRGVLDPGKTGEPGSFETNTYEFVYLQSATACEGAGEIRTAEGTSSGEGEQEVSQAVEGLTPDTEYSVCLVAHNEARTEEALSPKLTFKTAAAVAPEAPETAAPSEVRAETAVFDGVVNPNITSPVEPGTYEFLYKASSTATQAECESAGASSVPASPNGYAGNEPESVSEGVSGLTQDTEYVVCLAAANAGGMTVGPAVAFKTAIPPETPVTSEPPTGVSATEATLHGTLNPGAAGEAGTWEFRYNEGEGECNGGKAAPEPSGTSSGKQGEAVETTATGLSPGTTYTFCLLARNNAGEEAQGNPVVFTTPRAAPSIESESSSEVTASEARLEATINPGNSPTSYHFEYGTSESYGHSTPTEQIPARLTGQSVNTVITGLTPGTTYHYRAVAGNSTSPSGIDGTDEMFTTSPAAAGTGSPGSCPNEARRAEQPYGLTLPECRAYEMVSPQDTSGENATSFGLGEGSRASVSNEDPAITYPSRAAFGDPSAALLEDQFLSRRTPAGWTTQAITPPHFTNLGEPVEGSFEGTDFTPELTAGITTSTAPLVKGAPEAPSDGSYLAQFATGSYEYLGKIAGPPSVDYGTSSDLSRVVLTNTEDGSSPTTPVEWIGGSYVPISVTNTGETIEEASVGAMFFVNSGPYEKDAWHAVSSDGERVYFTSPGNTEQDLKHHEGPQQLYVRVNTAQPQSRLADGEAAGTGTLTEGSATVTSLVTATGEANGAPEGATELVVYTRTGHFVVGAEISGPGIAAGTTVAAVSGSTITLSEPTTAEIGGEARIESSGPMPFAVGQRVTGNGIAPGTSITAVAPGSLTLSVPAAASGTAVALVGGGECTVAADACTIEVSASQRFLHENPAGARSARFWGASADGSRVFFTSDAELTEDAYTGTDGEGANLYEYELETGSLKDLTGEAADASGEGAAVQGVVQVSEDGSYVYFVADGKLATGASQGEANLYVSHEGGAPVFIATLPANDISDWQRSLGNAESGEGRASPVSNTAVVTPSGTQLAFLSNRSLPTAESATGYDNEQADKGECEGEILKGENEAESGMCTEVYLYDAGSESQPPTLVCASCNPTGARPVGPSTLNTPAFEYEHYRPRDLTEDGTLFFASKDALVSGASSGLSNVYEYENGALRAISDVAGGYESFFLDASPNGENVFFASEDRLLPEDPGGDIVVWDARVDGGFPVAAAALCQGGEACKPAPTPQPSIYGAPASATFSGPGDLTPAPAKTTTTTTETRAQKLAAALKTCRKEKKKAKRTRCEKQARSRYAAKATNKKAKKKKAKKKKTEKKVKRARKASENRRPRS